jgi:hypothetical protein
MNPRQGCEDECNWLSIVNPHPLQELGSQRKAPEKNLSDKLNVVQVSC